MTNKALTIGVDIGGGHILSAAIDTAEGKILDETRSYVKVDNKGTTDEIMKTWSKGLNMTLSKIDTDRLAGIGFAMPGPFNYKTGLAMFERNDKYEALYNVNVVDELRGLLSVPDISMRFLNDATSFAVGVSWLGKAQNFKKSISITLGTGFGSAYIEDGLPIVEREDVPEHGCFWYLPFKDGIADDYFSTRWFLKEYKDVMGGEASGVKEIAEAAREDAATKAIFDTFGKNMGEFFVPWLKKFPADIIVMGGNVSGAFDLFSDSLKDVLIRNNINTVLAVSELLEDAALIGSARLFEEDFWQKVKDSLPTQ